MARKAREKSSTGMYNIILKSNEVLFKNEEDYNFFITILKDYITAVYAYALTPYYICLAVKESDKGISMDMKPLITKYARYYNRTYQTPGKLFGDRFKSEPINDEKELKNSIAIISNVADMCGEGHASEKAKKSYEMIDFYAKVCNVEIAKTKVVKPRPKKKAVAKVAKKPQTKKQEVKAPEEKKTAPKSTEQQRKNLPTWLL